jgi:GTP pyrophosphokinase
MVSVKQKFAYLPDGELDIDSWLIKAKEFYHLEDISLLENTCLLAKKTSKGLTTFYGQSCIEQGLEMAEIILGLHLDQQAVAAALMMSTMQHTKMSTETVAQKLGDNVAKLIQGAQQMSAIHKLPINIDKVRDTIQIDRFRKLLLAMASDIRVVLIKLAERTCIMRGIKGINPTERRRIAQETMDIYAPLANRLGIGQLKWELEDLSFHYIDPTSYKAIAKFLAERRVDREQRIHTIITRLKETLAQASLNASVSGRAKHIYSIYLKTHRKHTEYKHIYDTSAIRILVPTIEDCYSALSIVHQLWEHIPHEFDDYIATPKPNGYRSIHTAVIGPDTKNFEIQIRTKAMHAESERGVAAHWVYKENKSSQPDYEAKILFLRQLLDWHKDVATQETLSIPETAYQQVVEDRVYIFTPTGDILDLPTGATPLDCAYYIHSEVGNHCRGAKINGHIVPLTYTLHTGDQIEILTAPNGNPSRDWLKSGSGYLTTSRARAKVAHWFKQQDLDQHIEAGKRSLEREFARIGTPMNIAKLASRFNFKSEETFLSALGRGNLKIAHVIHTIETLHETSKPVEPPILTQKFDTKSKGMDIAGVTDLLTRIARCCKPIPGDNIVGYITQGRGVTIHKQKCTNTSFHESHNQDRLLKVTWDKEQTGAYYVDIQIRSHNRDNILKEITTLLNTSKIGLLSLNSIVSKNNNLITTLTIQIHAANQLQLLLNQIAHLSGVTEAKRVTT